MDQKKDYSTAILEQKKAPNKLIVSYFLTDFRLNKLLTMRTHPFNYLKPKWLNSKYSRAMLSLSREKKENKLLSLHWSIISLSKERLE